MRAKRNATRMRLGKKDKWGKEETSRILNSLHQEPAGNPNQAEVPSRSVSSGRPQQRVPMEVDGISEREAAIYDRQLRVWGLETQKRLSSSKVLILGCTGLAAEVAKNIVLAGIGALTLVDDLPCSSCCTNFLVPAAADPTTTVADASVAALQEMNPFVKVSAAPGSIAAALTAEMVQQFNLVLLVGQPADIISRADQLCSASCVAFYAAVSRGITGWAFANLHQHSYVVERDIEQPDGTMKKQAEAKSASYVPWDEAIASSLKGTNLRRTSKLYPVLKVVAQFEQQHGRQPCSHDLPALQRLIPQVAATQGFAEAAVDGPLLESYTCYANEMPAINAVLGGVLSNELLKAVSQKGDPICNLFLFSLTDGTGSVERAGGAAGGTA